MEHLATLQPLSDLGRSYLHDGAAQVVLRRVNCKGTAGLIAQRPVVLQRHLQLVVRTIRVCEIETVNNSGMCEVRRLDSDMCEVSRGALRSRRSFRRRRARFGNALATECRSHRMASGLHRWLFAGVDRDRLLDMDRRLAPARRNALAVLAVALLLGSPWLGPWTLAPLLLAAGLFGLATRLAGKSTRPEYLILGAWIVTEAIIALAVALTGGPRVATMGWLAIPIVTLFRFSERLAKIGAVIALTMLGAVAFATDPGAVIHDPPLLIAPAATIIAIAMLLVALIRSDTEHRTECVIDGLTGLLNRKAAESRAAELEQQAAVTGEPVALIEIDFDRFKRINDELGHAAGDAALAEVAYRFRKRVRAYDLVYRLSGEEFLMIVPGADLEEATVLAEDLRAAVASEPLSNGRRVTISAGVSASTRGETFSYRDVLREADLALYAAKESGRNRVCPAGTQHPASSPTPQAGLAGAAVGA